MWDLTWTHELRFVVALALGFLIGLERESEGARRGRKVLTGVRTYSIISIYGFGCGWLHTIGVAGALPVGMASIVVLVAIEYVIKFSEGHSGWTSEVSALVAFVVGALALLADVWVAMALGVIGTILLSEKAEIETFVERLDRAEFLAVLRFLLIAFIILPALPDREFTRFGLNPVGIWRIVILVSTIGFTGYVLGKHLGTRMGFRLAGLLGGVVSSTAVAVAMGRAARDAPERSRAAMQAAILAGSVMYARILALIWILRPGIVGVLGWRLAALAAVGVTLAMAKTEPVQPAETAPTASLRNPFEIRPALVFAALFVLLTIVTGMIRDALGNPGLLGLSAVVGVADVDPFILSLARSASVETAVAVPAILIACMSNTIAKGVYFGALASSVRGAVAWRYALWAAAHLPLAFIPV